MNNTSLLIDTNVLNEVELTLKEFLYLYQLYKDINIFDTTEQINKEKLQELQFIKILKEKTIIRQKTVELIEFLTIESTTSFINNKKKISKSRRKINEEVDDRIDEFRHKWKGFKTGAMGSPKSCKQKLTRWMKENPEYSFDDILKAVDLYLKSIDNPRFVQRADYFIFKQTINKEEESRLSAYIEDIKINQPEDDWTSRII